jgi:protease-4
MKDFLKYTLATVVGVFVVTIVGFFLLMIIFSTLIASTEKQVAVQDKSMLVIDMNRTIVDRAPKDPFENLNIPGFEQVKKVGLDKILKSIKKAQTDDRIKGIYLKASIANTGLATIEEIRNALIAFRDSCHKPVYSYSEMMCDQKAYYLASVADKVVVHPMGSLDFRGLGGEMLFFKNALDKLGVEVQIVRHGKFKAAVEPFMLDKMSGENREQTMTYLNSLWGHMLKGISAARKIPVEKLNILADSVMTFRKGEELVKTGLVDAAKYKDEVLDDLREITGIKPKKGIPIIGVNDYASAPVKTKPGKGFSKNKIAVIYASGEIGMAFGSEGINGEDLAREIRKIRLDSAYKAIVIRVNSPGGMAFDSEEIWREMKLASDEKVVVASLGDVAASGGFYIACPADKIIAGPTTITGSIGVFGMIPNAGELLNKKLGITTDVVKTNANSNLISLSRKMTDYERLLMQNNVENIYDAFILHVSDGRKMAKTAVDEIGQGRVWSGENAKGIGLVDDFGGLDFAVAEAAKMADLKDYRTISLPDLPDPIQQLFKAGTNNVRTWWLKKELGENYKYYEQAKKASLMNGIYARMPFDLTIN